MSGRDSFPPYPQTRIASMERKPAVVTQYSPRRNRLLAALPLVDYARLRPHLEGVALPVGWTVHGIGDREEYLYFLTAGLVSMSYISANGTSTEFAVTGNEGVIGVATILGGESMLNQAAVLSTGYAYRLGAVWLKNVLKHHEQLLSLLLRYTQALIVQTGQMAACNRHHSVEQQLCRWILSSLDRLPSNDLMLTQERIADSLSVRRESVTEAAIKLQRAGLIHYSRGHIAVTDRSLLEAHACECYSVVKREYERLLPAEISVGDAVAHTMAAHDTCSISRHPGLRPSATIVELVPA